MLKLLPFLLIVLVTASCVPKSELGALTERVGVLEQDLRPHQDDAAEPQSTPEERVNAHIRCVRELCAALTGDEYAACVTACAEAAKGGRTTSTVRRAPGQAAPGVTPAN